MLFAAISYYWHLPLMIVLISLVYGATRYDEGGMILHESMRWGAKLFGFLLTVMVILFVVAAIT